MQPVFEVFVMRRVGFNPCTYCGMPAETLDHVPPRRIRKMLKEEEVRRWPFVTVASCLECNSLLGSLRLMTVIQRKAYIKKRIRDRYGKFLKAEEWTDDELSELGPSLRESVAEMMEMSKIVRKRLKW